MSYTNYKKYLEKSIYIFVFFFVFGIYTNHLFVIIQKKYETSPLLTGFLQLITIVSVIYYFHKFRVLHDFFTDYSPNVLFSTFIISLQTNMIKNFKIVLVQDGN